MLGKAIAPDPDTTFSLQSPSLTYSRFWEDRGETGHSVRKWVNLADYKLWASVLSNGFFSHFPICWVFFCEISFVPSSHSAFHCSLPPVSYFAFLFCFVLTLFSNILLLPPWLSWLPEVSSDVFFGHPMNQLFPTLRPSMTSFSLLPCGPFRFFSFFLRLRLWLRLAIYEAHVLCTRSSGLTLSNAFSACLMCGASWPLHGGAEWALFSPRVSFLKAVLQIGIWRSELLFISQHWAAKSLKRRAAAAHPLMLTPSHCRGATHTFPDRWPLSLYLSTSNSGGDHLFYCWMASCLKFSSALFWNWSFHGFSPKSSSAVYFANV